MESLVHSGKYGAISTYYLTNIYYYAVKFLSNKVTLKGDNNKHGRIFKSGELAVKYVYLIIMKSNTNWFVNLKRIYRL